MPLSITPGASDTAFRLRAARVNGTATGNGTRIVVLICSISDLAIVTVVAPFLIAIQSSFTMRETLVLHLESHVTLRPAGIAILEAYACEGIVPRLAAFFDAWIDVDARTSDAEDSKPLDA